MSLPQIDRLTHVAEIPWKTFVKESGEVTERPPKKQTHQLCFKGDEAKAAYEEIISQTTNTNLQFGKHKHVKSKTFGGQNNSKKTPAFDEIVPKITINMILRAVEQKDDNFLLKHVTSENVNLADDFGWTPLMSAAYCGHLDIIKFLLSLGANRRARDKSGLTAAQLALKKNFLSIVALLRKKTDCPNSRSLIDLTVDISGTCAKPTSPTQSETVEPLKDHNGSTCKSTDHSREHSLENRGFYCEICKANFLHTTPRKHETSTLHIFNTKPKLSNAMYGIGKHNKGYQMLLNTGWDEQGGLGPSGKGMQYPIKTYLKMDRKGLGQAGEKECRVTHFKPGDVSAISHLKMSKQKGLKKRDREKLLNREARKERALRIALS